MDCWWCKKNSKLLYVVLVAEFFVCLISVIFEHVFFEDFGENNINYLFNTQDAIITNDFVFTISTPDTTAWLDSIISNSGGNGVQGGLFDSVVSETNVESSQNGITMSKSVIKSKNLAIFSERNEKEESIY